MNDNTTLTEPATDVPESSAPTESTPLESPSEEVQPVDEEALLPSGDNPEGIDLDNYKELDEPGEEPSDQEPVQEEVPPLWDFFEQNYDEEQLAALTQELVWNFLQDEEGNVSIDSIQTIIDQLTDQPGTVLAADLISIIDKIQSKLIDPAVLNQDLEGYDQYRQVQQEKYRTQYTQEIHERGQKVKEFVSSVDLPGKLNFAIERFGLVPTEQDTPLSSDFKRSLQERMNYTGNSFAANNPHLKTVMALIQEASQPGGPTLEELQRDSVFQVSFQRGMQELQTHIDKSIAREALMYKYILAGYNALNPPTSNN